MDQQVRALARNIIDTHRVMTIATIRPDGWPQATTVGYASDGLQLYFLCGAESQKAANIAACNKVSLTIGDDSDDMLGLKGISLGGVAEFVTDPMMFPVLYRKLIEKYPQAKDLPEPDHTTVRYVRVTPKVISLLDYSKGFAHTDLATVESADLAA